MSAPNSENPLPDPEVHAIDADNGWVLRVFDFRPSGAVRGVVVAGHAMMVDSRTLCRADRATLCATLVASGFRVLAPDLRGHGESGPRADRGDWNYDDLVSDVGNYVALAKRLEPGLPLVLLGHSLFGHLSLAWLGQHPDAGVQAVVCLAVEVWNRRFESYRRIWWIKRAIYALSSVIVALVGRLPARRMRQGSADEARGYWMQFRQFVRGDCWTSRDGVVDYWAGLREVACPVLFLASEGDRIFGRPQSALSFSSPLPNREAVVVGRDDAPLPLPQLEPTHMGLVTDVTSQPVWRFVTAWIRGVAGRPSSS